MPRLPRLQPNIAQLQRGVRHPAWPAPGFFRLKQVRKGPWTPALIWAECPMVIPEPLENTSDPADWCCPTDPWRGPRWLRATIGDDEVDPLEVWARGQKITAQEYFWRLALRAWAVAEAPREPEAAPYQPVNLSRQPSLF
jgi:hypothetical protein